MSTDFSRTLSLLRKEKGISQRVAAADLGISQALMSHYENGIREPGLAFVVRACDYYKVSADYLLGRTMARDGSVIDAQELYDVSTQKDNALRGSIMAQLNKKLVVNAISLLYGLLGKMGNREVITLVSDYLSDAVYTVFRSLYQTNPENRDKFFSMDRQVFQAGAVDVSMAAARTDFQLELERLSQEKEFQAFLEEQGPLDEAYLQREYPAMYHSLLQVLHNTSGRILKQIEARRGAEKK